MVELSQKAKHICKSNYHCCDKCPINKECFRNPTITHEKVNDYVQSLNDKAEAVIRSDVH